VKSKSICKPALRRVGVGILTVTTALSSAPMSVIAQTRPAPAPPTASPRGTTDIAGASALQGRPVEDVRVLGNTQVSTPVILNLVRTHPGDKFDPITAQEDYQRIYGLRKFSNVEARVEPTATGGVVVVFIVSEEKQLRDVILRGNLNLNENTVRDRDAL
jgi:outer membrane protein assembly factor BamA